MQGLREQPQEQVPLQEQLPALRVPVQPRVQAPQQVPRPELRQEVERPPVVPELQEQLPAALQEHP